jgi:hypothetical protein
LADFEAWLSEGAFADAGLQEGDPVVASWSPQDVHWLASGQS